MAYLKLREPVWCMFAAVKKNLKLMWLCTWWFCELLLLCILTCDDIVVIEIKSGCCVFNVGFNSLCKLSVKPPFFSRHIACLPLTHTHSPTSPPCSPNLYEDTPQKFYWGCASCFLKPCNKWCKYRASNSPSTNIWCSAILRLARHKNRQPRNIFCFQFCLHETLSFKLLIIIPCIVIMSSPLSLPKNNHHPSPKKEPLIFSRLVFA